MFFFRRLTDIFSRDKIEILFHLRESSFFFLLASVMILFVEIFFLRE